MNFRYRYNEAYQVHSDFVIALNSSAIFLQPELKTLFVEFGDLMTSALNEQAQEYRFPHPRPNRWAARDKLHKEGETKRQQLEDAVRARLWDQTVQLA